MSKGREEKEKGIRNENRKRKEDKFRVSHPGLLTKSFLLTIATENHK